MATEKKALFIFFGATGDLARRKLYPSLFRLYQKGFLKDHFAVIGTARRPWSDEYFHGIILESLEGLDASEEDKKRFSEHFYYLSHDVNDTQHYLALKKMGEELDERYQLEGNRIYYMAMAPQFFGIISEHLKTEKITDARGFNRLIIEKPFGHDHKSATELNEQIGRAFSENQIYRIDHYLGKEMVQNISAIRFGNGIFEKIWDNRFIDNVQITLGEALGVEERAGYYEQSGALRDMVQNHILQILSLLAMEPPATFKDRDIRAEKIKVLQSLHPLTPETVNRHFVRGQYGPSTVEGKQNMGYREADNVSPTSEMETFVAGEIQIDNYRWKDVPFYVRTGKRLSKKATQIDVVFKKPTINVFGEDEEHTLESNVLSIYIQPEEGFSLTMNGKKIGQGFETQEVALDYSHDSETISNTPEAYEKLILDALNGDSTNFTHWDEVCASWKYVDVIRQAWDQTTPDFPNYPSGSMGPVASDLLLERTNRKWILNPQNHF